MAIIYRYELVNTKIRKIINLKEYENVIINTIQNEFDKNLKDCFVSNEYYEFKLFKSLTNNEKREFGKKLLEKSNNLKMEIDKLKNKDSHMYFQRMKQKFYAYINEAEIELIDALDFKNKEDMLIKSQNYIKKLNLKLNENDNLSLLFYMDTYTLDGKTLKIIQLKNKIQEESISFKSKFFLIEGKSYTQYNDNINDKLTINNDDNPKKYNLEIIEGFNITKIFKQNEKELKEIENLLNIYLNEVDEIKIKKTAIKKDINFNVFNVGQALCTCIDTINEKPILFFDFGITKDNHTTVAKYIKEKPPIIISHLHKDHWNALNKFSDAYNSNWYIPNQDLKIQFKKKCAQIIFSKGTIQYIKNNSVIKFDFGKLISSSPSSSHVHETGLIFKLELINDKGEEKNILIPGDQIYEKINNIYLENLDILVASHHGGEYFIKTNNNLFIPLAKENSIVVYSANNTKPYFHPTYKKDYISRNWNKEHVTYVHGDYKFK